MQIQYQKKCEQIYLYLFIVTWFWLVDGVTLDGWACWEGRNDGNDLGGIFEGRIIVPPLASNSNLSNQFFYINKQFKEMFDKKNFEEFKEKIDICFLSLTFKCWALSTCGKLKWKQDIMA